MDKNKLLELIIDYDNRVMDRDDLINEINLLEQSHNSECTTSADEPPTPKLCPICKKNEMSHYATNLYCQSCGHIIT